MKKKLAIIFGTRPEIIKLSPIIKLCLKTRVPFFCVHTGQHFSYEMDEIFFTELGLPGPEYKLNIKSKAPFRQGDHTGRMLIELEKILLKEMPYCIVVQGDTNTVLAAALTAEKISTTESYTGFHIRIAHVESGLRSFDRSMPEETNRFIVDHLSDYLFVPTQKAKDQLLKEGVPKNWVYVTGNTIVDAVKNSLRFAKNKSKILKNLKLQKRKYILLTLHRQENVDSRKIFANLLKGIALVSQKTRLPIIFPIHPRTLKRLSIFGLRLPAGIISIKPVGFLDFLWLEANARLIMTDSGGAQEEACILKVPCLTLRDNTERPETVAAGANMIAGRQPQDILNAALKMIKVKNNWQNPLGDGKASSRILKTILKR